MRPRSEKYDVVKRSHDVFAEYGNVGTDFDYICEEGFGWVNSSFQLGMDVLHRLDPALLERLHRLEDVFSGSEILKSYADSVTTTT